MLGIFKLKQVAITGVVSRVGPWIGHGESHGIVLTLKEHPKPFVILRDGSVDNYAGLTQAGDEVSFEAADYGEHFVVGLSSFCNKTIAAQADS